MSYQDRFIVTSEDLDSSLVSVDTINLKPNHSFAKRAIDLIGASVLSVLLIPLILLISLLIKLGDGDQVFYFQKRIGRGGREFNCYKFRTMVKNADFALAQLLKSDPSAALQWEQDQKLKKDPRVTRLGTFLRKTSLDEIPQLWNIIKGEMSLVGPRPIVKDEVSKYGSYFADYISVLPGVTGLWQISGRNDTTYAERVLFDVEYARKHTVLNDLKIILLTVPAVLWSRGAY